MAAVPESGGGLFLVAPERGGVTIAPGLKWIRHGDERMAAWPSSLIDVNSRQNRNANDNSHASPSFAAAA